MWDVVIIGGGLAGLIAGVRAAGRGKDVILVAAGAGSLSNASGVLDFGDWKTLLGKEDHPYYIVGEDNILMAQQSFLASFPQYEGQWGMPNKVLTPLGEVRPAGLVPRYLSARPLERAKHIVVVALAGMKDFFPDVFRVNLAKNFPLAGVTVQEFHPDAFEAWYRNGKSVSAVDYCRFWRSPAGVSYLKEMLVRVGADFHSAAGTREENCVVFPGLCAGFSKVLQSVLADQSFSVVETTLFPPSPLGSHLYESLCARFKALGGEVMIGAKVIGSEVKDGVCRQVRVSNAGKETGMAGVSFVLASGGLLGGGIEAGPSRVREPVFGLPLYVPEKWSTPVFVGEQPYAHTGVEVDSNLCPLDSSGQRILTNVKVCGRMLAHWDPWTEHCGGGVSLASGILAGDLV